MACGVGRARKMKVSRIKRRRSELVDRVASGVIAGSLAFGIPPVPEKFIAGTSYSSHMAGDAVMSSPVGPPGVHAGRRGTNAASATETGGGPPSSWHWRCVFGEGHCDARQASLHRGGRPLQRAPFTAWPPLWKGRRARVCGAHIVAGTRAAAIEKPVLHVSIATGRNRRRRSWWGHRRGSLEAPRRTLR